MSLETWKSEFYPEDADDAARRGPEAATEHSIRKWTGLSKKNLAAHGVKRVGKELRRGELERLEINSSSCALCIWSEGNTRQTYDWMCGVCPLSDYRHGSSCDEPMLGEKSSPYEAFIDKGSYAPMLKQ